MATITRTLNQFRSELGFVEGPNNDNPFAACSDHANHQPWCASFAVCQFRSVGMKLGNESAYTPSLFQSLKDEGLEIHGPRRGAVVFFYFPSMGRIAHVGIIESVRSDGTFETIEGNTDVAGGRTGGRVMRKARANYNTFFAMPKYDKPRVGKVRQLQNLLELKEDGVWGDKTDRRALHMRSAARAHTGRPQIRREFDMELVKEILNVPRDGKWNQSDQDALRSWVRKLQRVLDVRASGYWDSRTEAAFLTLRKRRKL